MPVRPHVIINAAMSVDGKIALSDGKAVRLSNEEDLRRVHRLRAEADAILVGVGTVLMDDPKLTVKAKYAKGRNPLRVVLDSDRSEEHTSELQSQSNLVCRLLLEKKNKK